MPELWMRLAREFLNYADYLGTELTQFRVDNYLLWLVGLSFVCLLIEKFAPWKSQPVLRRDFWLDGFYMFFNFFIFPLLGFQAVAAVVSYFVGTKLSIGGVDLINGHLPATLSPVVRLILLFVVRDFIQWNLHRVLHRFQFLWRFHEIHHSVEEMGFAAHLRFHPFETMFYRALEFLPLALLGFGVTDMFVAHIFALAVGHLNHTNVKLPLGPLKYIFNNPQMHRWHHVRDLPDELRFGVNFGLTLSVWDYLFGTAYVPHDGAEEALGVSEQERFPNGFLGQLAYPFKRDAR